MGGSSVTRPCAEIIEAAGEYLNDFMVHALRVHKAVLHAQDAATRIVIMEPIVRLRPSMLRGCQAACVGLYGVEHGAIPLALLRTINPYSKVDLEVNVVRSIFLPQALFSSPSGLV